MSNILWMIIIIILFIIILLLIKLKITLNYTKKDSEIKGCIKILILKKIKIYTLTYPSNPKKNKNNQKNRNIKKLIKLAKPCLKDFKKFITEILKSINIIKIENHIIYGNDSYANTGKNIGIIWSILSIINSIDKNIKITAEPIFTGQKLDCHGKNEIEIRLIRLIKPIIKLISKRNVLKFIKGVIDER